MKTDPYGSAVVSIQRTPPVPKAKSPPALGACHELSLMQQLASSNPIFALYFTKQEGTFIPSHDNSIGRAYETAEVVSDGTDADRLLQE